MRKDKKIHRGTYAYICDNNCKILIKMILLFKKEARQNHGAQITGTNHIKGPINRGCSLV